MNNSIRNYDHIGQFSSADVLHSQLQNKDYSSALKQIALLKKQIADYDFQLDSKTYSRHILSKKNGLWLLLIHWDENVKTCIHGHPERSFVYILNGLMEVENFKLNPLQTSDKTIVKPDQYIYHDGTADRFDNAVHRVHAKHQTLSLHFYSDDPTKGNFYGDAEETCDQEKMVEGVIA